MHRMRSLFDEPARVADSNFLRREIANRMHERLSLVKIEPQRVLDLGCGEGADFAPLRELYPEAHLLGVDASFPLLAGGRRGQSAAVSSMTRLLGKLLPKKIGTRHEDAFSLLCSDFAQLPLKPASADLVWSNLALHWHPQPDLVFGEWRRVLRVDGLLMFSCFGPDTFREIRAAFAQVDALPHTLNFVDMHDLGDMLVNTGFSTPVMDMETITVTYESTDKLLADVQAWGGNPLLTRRKGLLGRNAGARLHHALEGFRGTDGKIPLTFEVVYGHAFRPAPTKTAEGESIIRFDLPRKRQ
ncbi:methyltransferase domain-containing protein [Noviherbaspirillum denitrificans]|uniref:Methyltransferase n=1 Tax=Noviherbaspirillum denitrificans TaxID=1968433 RepID=A0A254TH62_9BURK|nr:methyltransferase domain-containing protein [Noviherbaspirillum denitrificans]OWW21507.1 methyltransferase [Noviherbaspirillum denitrificans]